MNTIDKNTYQVFFLSNCKDKIINDLEIRYDDSQDITEVENIIQNNYFSLFEDFRY